VIATDTQPAFAGKPYPYLLELALKRLNTPRENTIVVGDRLETDIAGGQGIGCPTALVLSGVSTLAQAQAWTPSVDFIADTLADLIGAV
jgi:ribonucleotide monophosphatase NagD (HAD superfamily)